MFVLTVIAATFQAEFAQPPGAGDLARPWSRYSEGASRNPATQARLAAEHQARLDRARQIALNGGVSTAAADGHSPARNDTVVVNGETVALRAGRGEALLSPEEQALARARRAQQQALAFHPALRSLTAEQRERVLSDQRFLDYMDTKATGRAEQKTFWDNNDQSRSTNSLRALLLARREREQGFAVAHGETYETLMASLKAGKGKGKGKGDDGDESTDDEEYFENPAVSAAVRDADADAVEKDSKSKAGSDDDEDEDEEVEDEDNEFVSELLKTQATNQANKSTVSDADYFKMKASSSFDSDDDDDFESDDNKNKNKNTHNDSDSDDEDSRTQSASKSKSGLTSRAKRAKPDSDSDSSDDGDSDSSDGGSDSGGDSGDSDSDSSDSVSDSSDDDDSKVKQASKRSRPASKKAAASESESESDSDAKTKKSKSKAKKDAKDGDKKKSSKSMKDDEDDDGLNFESDDEDSKDSKNSKKDAGAGVRAATNVPRDLTPAQAEAMVLESGRLFLRRLPFSVTEAELRSALDRFGDVSELSLPLDLQRQSKGFATAAFTVPEHALAAMRGLDGKLFQGRIINVLPGTAPLVSASAGAGGAGSGPIDPNNPFAGLGDDELRKMTHKKKKELLERARAQQGHNWNSLFISPNTVAEAVANKFQMAKAALLGADAAEEQANIGVRMAVAETHMIQETKKYLEACGVDLDAFVSTPSAATGARGAAQRSTTTILVKNLPFATEDAELRKLFKRFGALARFVLPPYKTVALVDFADSSAAKKAFTALAYKKFHTAPLYLEWAPRDCLKPLDAAAAAAMPGAVVALSADGRSTTDVAAALDSQDRLAAAKGKTAAAAAAMLGGADSAAASSAPESAGEGADADTPEDLDSRSVYVKNMSFDTKEDGFRAALGALCQKAWEKHCATLHQRGKTVPATPWAVRAVRIAHRTATAADKGRTVGEKLSLGYGFVEFSTGAAAAGVVAAATAQRGLALDGHLLELRVSRRGEASAPASGLGGRAAGDISGARAQTILRERGVVTDEKRREQEEWSQRSTKLIVRNVPFEANVGEIRELFAAFGQLRRCRMPEKADRSSHRGFAFVDFVTAQEARNAHAALQSTHLLGRHLVLEWANPDETVEELREKTRKAQETRAQNATAGFVEKMQKRF